MKSCIITGDGSTTLYSQRFGEHYHSTHGAIQESQHVFIDAGLKPFLNQERVSVFEVGFGAGLNTLLTYQTAKNISIDYVAVEAFPISDDQINQLNYDGIKSLHDAPWNEWVQVTPTFRLFKVNQQLQDFNIDQQFDLIYFDAFSPESQPELWTEDIFKKIFLMCKDGAVLTTYCAKGAVRRALQSVGFKVEKFAGPLGKRECIKAIKSKK